MTYNGGAVTAVVATVNGVAVPAGNINHNASADRYDISFEGKVLESIDFLLIQTALEISQKTLLLYISLV